MNGAWVNGVLSGMSGRDATDPNRATIIISPRRLRAYLYLGETESTGTSRLGNLCAGTMGAPTLGRGFRIACAASVRDERRAERDAKTSKPTDYITAFLDSCNDRRDDSRTSAVSGCASEPLTRAPLR